MTSSEPDHYGTLGLDRRCTRTQIRDAYRLLAKRYHPDVNQEGGDASVRTQALNNAHEVLSDPARRRAYDRTLDEASRVAASGRSEKIARNISKEIRLRIEDFLRGTSMGVQVNDPANPDGVETYKFTLPRETAPGARFRLPRVGAFEGGFVELRLRVLPSFRFKIRGSDLLYDLRISSQRAQQGGTEMIERPTGGFIRVGIPSLVKRGEVIRIPGEGMPRPRGGRGDLLARITYKPDVRITHTR